MPYWCFMSTFIKLSKNSLKVNMKPYYSVRMVLYYISKNINSRKALLPPLFLSYIPRYTFVMLSFIECLEICLDRIKYSIHNQFFQGFPPPPPLFGEQKPLSCFLHNKANKKILKCLQIVPQFFLTVCHNHFFLLMNWFYILYKHALKQRWGMAPIMTCGLQSHKS